MTTEFVHGAAPSGFSEVRDVERHYVGGWYTVIYDGEGILDFSMDVTCVHRMSRNHIQIYVNLTTGLNNGIGIRLTDTNEADPVRLGKFESGQAKRDEESEPKRKERKAGKNIFGSNASLFLFQI